MGKKNKQFIDKNKAITFKLISRDKEDPEYDHKNADERVF
jgi:hypothetical protein